MDDLELADQLAAAADAISMAAFRSRGLAVHRKADHTEVTDADREVERRLRDMLADARPDDAIVGEEFGGDRSIQGRRWVIDPIDGTRAYIRGNETWATLIALQEDGQTVVAVASGPAMGQRYQARRGAGATMNGSPLMVSGVTTVEEALLAHTSVSGFIRAGVDDRLRTLAGRCWDARGLGNSFSHLAVARGSADLGWTSRANLWDFAALALIVEEAGGRFTDRSGTDGELGAGLSSNGLLHATLLEAAGPPVTWPATTEPTG
jgi:histidinol-phosphatase